MDDSSPVVCTEEFIVSSVHCIDVGTQTTRIGHEIDETVKKLQENKKLRRETKILQQRLKRKDARINNIGDVIKMLRKGNVSNAQLELRLDKNFGNVTTKLMENQSLNCQIPPSQRSYYEEVKKFALTLYLYSPKSYKYDRTILVLPHPSTIRKMLTTRNCQFGVLSEVLKFLREKLAEKEHEYLKDVALMFDSMSIRKGIKYDKKNDKYSGFVDLGGIILNNVSKDNSVYEQDVDDIPTNLAKENEKKKVEPHLATEALVFSIVSYTKMFKVPIGYFFVNKISGLLLKELTLTIIRSLYEVGVTVRSLTANGFSANITAFKMLGWHFTYVRNMKSSFQHP